MRFAKAHGTGNDFVVLPDPDGAIDLHPAMVVALCDRRRGIGGDGVLRVVRSAKHPDAEHLAADAEWFMDYRNSDGSIAEMCGNGVRAYARYLVESGLVAPGFGEPGSIRLPIGTRSGVVLVHVGPDAITVDLPRPVVGEASGATISGATVSGATGAGVRFAGTVVVAGNPNLVCGVPDVSTLESLDLTRPPVLDAATFPHGANVEFITPGAPVDRADVHVHMRVVERGSGETLSCGSGACAVAAVALRDAGLVEGVVAVDVPGGRLTVRIDASGCHLTGPAVVVATGEIDPSALPIG